jgi:hypothetical protein
MSAALYEKFRKIVKTFSGPTDLYRKGHDFLGHSLYKGQQIFFTIMTSWVSKDYVLVSELNVHSKDINLH